MAAGQKSRGWTLLLLLVYFTCLITTKISLNNLLWLHSGEVLSGMQEACVFNNAIPLLS